MVDLPNTGEKKVSGADIRANAERAIAKARRDSLEGKLKSQLTKRVEHERALAQIDAEIQADIDLYENGA